MAKSKKNKKKQAMLNSNKKAPDVRFVKPVQNKQHKKQGR